MNKRLQPTAVSLILFSLIIGGCSPSLQNLAISKKLVSEYYESGQYEKELQQILNDVKPEIDKTTPGKMSVVIFDVDETTLSNYKFMKQYDFGYERHIWDDWIAKAEAEPIIPVRDFYNYLLEKGFRIIFITGRRDYHYQPTYDNLKAVGYTQFDSLITRSEDEYKISAVEFKSAVRHALTQKGYEIKANFGDQQSDLDGGNSGITVKLPNYQYGVD